MTQAWWTEVGLFFDMVAFAILSVDFIRTMKGERIAREEIFALERAAFAARYGVLSPQIEVSLAEDRAFDEAQAKRREESERDMYSRSFWAWLAISLAGIGFAMQLYGGLPR